MLMKNLSNLANFGKNLNVSRKKKVDFEEVIMCFTEVQ